MSEPREVLVVDDEPVVLDGARLVLEAAGYRVATAGDEATALAHPAVDRCDLVLCDLMLSGTSGLDLMRALRARRPTLPVVVMTGYATADRAVEALRAGAAAFLPKPFDEIELINQVRRAFADAAVAVKESET
jgi:DNA-binding NtrC family response regulator